MQQEEATLVVEAMGEALSKEFIVASEIRHANRNNEKIWFSKLVDILKPIMSKVTVAKSIDTLFDWNIVKGEYGETTPGHAGRLLKVTNESKDKMNVVYEEYWAPYRDSKLGLNDE